MGPDCRDLNAGHLPGALHGQRVERNFPFRRVAVQTQIHSCGSQAARIHAEVRRQARLQAADEKAGADEEQNRDRRLSDDQPTARTPRGVPAVSAQPGRRSRTTCAYRGEHPEEDGRQDRRNDVESQHARVESHVELVERDSPQYASVFALSSLAAASQATPSRKRPTSSTQPNAVVSKTAPPDRPEKSPPSPSDVDIWIGNQSCGDTVRSVPRKRAGATPTIVYDRPPARTVEPIASGWRAKKRNHAASLNTTTGFPPTGPSSDACSNRPAWGRSPSTSKKFP